MLNFKKQKYHLFSNKYICQLLKIIQQLIIKMLLNGNYLNKSNNSTVFSYFNQLETIL